MRRRGFGPSRRDRGPRSDAGIGSAFLEAWRGSCSLWGVPTIVLTCSRDHGAAEPPLAALRRAGWQHTIVVARPGEPMPEVDACGLLLAGGVDVEPHRWARADVPASAHAVDPARDELELRLLRNAWARRVPVLGICRGAQLMAVARGGTLIPDIATDCDVLADTHQYGSALDELVRHEVVLDAGSRLRRVLGARRVGVNSRHHQAVRDPGEGLIAVGYDHDTGTPYGDLIEAIEAEDPGHWAVGVQWHPENLVRRTDAVGGAALRLFAALGDAALEYASGGARLSATG